MPNDPAQTNVSTDRDDTPGSPPVHEGAGSGGGAATGTGADRAGHHAQRRRQLVTASLTSSTSQTEGVPA